MVRFLLVVVGGGLGSGARYLLSGWTLGVLGPAFPWGTLAVNALGSFLLGGLMHVGLTTEAVAPDLRVALSTGVLGGFTTYSTFNYETTRYLQEGAWGMGALNVLGTVAACLAAGLLGHFAARLLVGH